MSTYLQNQTNRNEKSKGNTPGIRHSPVVPILVQNFKNVRKICRPTLLFSRHGLTSPRSQPPAVSDPTGSEISCLQMAKSR